MDNKPVTHSLFQQVEYAAAMAAADLITAGHRVCLSALVRSGTENRSRETRGGRRDGRVRGEAREERIKNKAFIPDSLFAADSTRSETRRRSSPSAGRPLASIYASANANRPRLSLCTPSVLPSLVRPRPSSRLPSSIHGIARVGLRRLRI